MQLYPAIDMKDGKCVRLTKGLFDNITVYSDTPADMAKLWVSQGATFLHLVDLDGALAGHSVNAPAIENWIPGVIIGKALYEKRISLPDAVARFQ